MLPVGKVANERRVFIVDRGSSPSGQPLGKWKVQVNSVQQTSYDITYSKLDGSQLQTATLSKDPRYNKIAFSFNTNTTIQIEPAKTEYDMVFTQYTFKFDTPPMNYAVTGVLINPYNTEVAIESNLAFSEIDHHHAQSLFYSTDADVIGYGWKSFDLQANQYAVDSKMVYLLKEASGNLFKLHFLDFYDENGVKGTASFELMRL